MKKLSSIIFFLAIFCVAKAQNTYTWNVLAGSWTTAASWTPTRTTPAANDILIFNGSVTPTASVTNLPRQTVGRLRVINNASVRLNGGTWTSTTGTLVRSGNTITGTGTSFLTEIRVGEQFYTGTLPSPTTRGEIATITSNTVMNSFASGTIASSSYFIPPSIFVKGGASPALEIQSGSTLILAGANPPVCIFVDSGTTASIAGRLIMSSDRSRLYGVDSASIVVQSGGAIRTDSTFTGNPFTQVGVSNTHIFAPGSSFEFLIGSNLFGLSSPASKAYFSKGSNYIQMSANAPSLSGRTYANFIYRTSATISSTGSNTFGIDSLIVDSGVFNLNLTGAISILGNIRVNSPGTLNFSPATPSTITMSSTTQQEISGNGTLTFTNPVNFAVNNSNGVKLNRNLALGGARLVLTSGNINLNGNSLTLGTSAVAPGSLSRSGGNVHGTGTFTRWFGTTPLTMGQDTGAFPMSENNNTHPLWISGTPTTGGTVTVAYNNTSGISTMGTPFNDNATNNVSVNVRTNRNWVVSTGNGFAGTGLGLRLGTTTDPGTLNNPTNIRITLASAVAPGTAVDGGGTFTSPYAERSGLTDAQLNNTFYIGANSTQNPLPASLISFNGRVLQNKDAEISWVTASELNVSSFVLQRSLDGSEFTNVSEIKAKGISSEKVAYLFTDMGAFSQHKTIYYRLNTIDANGHSELSPIIALTASFPKNSVALPNPVNAEVNISFNTLLNGLVTIDVKDMQGRSVYNTQTEVKNQSGLNLNLSDLKAGIYMLHVNNGTMNQMIRIQKY